MRARRRQRSLSTSVLVAILVMAEPLLTATQQKTGRDEDAITRDHPWIGEPAPEFHLASTKGQSVALSDFKGRKLLVMHFAASW